MSLQGSLDTFALPDVLALLAATAKTGELQVTGSSSDGHERETRVWFDRGRLAGHDDGGSPTIADCIVSLLRMGRGSFTFTPGPVPAANQTDEVGPVLAAAQTQLAEWVEIESVLPSPTAWLQLAARAPRDELTVTAEQWRLIVAVGRGCSVHSAVTDFGGGELPGFRAVKDMVADGLLTVGAETGAERIDSAPDPGPERLEWATPVSSWGESTLATPPVAGWTAPLTEEGYGALRVVPDLGDDATSDSATAAVPAWRAEMAEIHDLDALVARPLIDGPVPTPETTPEVGPVLADAAPIAAPGLPGDEGGTPAEGGEPLNRGLLLKFLSSVRT